MEALGLLLYGFKVLMTWKILALMMVGLVLGIFVGVLPGLGGPNGVAILLPLTFTMDPTSAIVMLSCIYWGALFGGAITSILFNIPGEAWSVATTFDGYPMAQQGKAAEALTAAFTSSFIGSLVAVMLITFLAPGIASFALRFGPPEFFAVLLITFLSPLVAKFALKFGPPEFFSVYLLTFCAFASRSWLSAAYSSACRRDI